MINYVLVDGGIVTNAGSVQIGSKTAGAQNNYMLVTNGFRLDSSTGANSLAGGYTFADNLGGTNYARLELINGVTALRGSAVTIGSTGSVLFSNTTATVGCIFTNNGTMTIK